MSKVKFYFEDGRTKTFNLAGSTRGLRHEGKRPYMAAVYGPVISRQLEIAFVQESVRPAVHPEGVVKIMNGLDK
jgi:hypothetical protein